MATIAKSLEDAVEELMKDYKKAAQTAAKYATNQMKEDLYNKALGCLQQYYYNYEPKSYDRTYSLKNALVSFGRTITSNQENKIKCSMGVQYDYDRLNGSYNKERGEDYNSWNPPESQWIVENYLSGIHPTTNGATESSAVKRILIRDKISPESYMRTHIILGEKEFQNYMMISFLDQILRR